MVESIAEQMCMAYSMCSMHIACPMESVGGLQEEQSSYNRVSRRLATHMEVMLLRLSNR